MSADGESLILSFSCPDPPTTFQTGQNQTRKSLNEKRIKFTKPPKKAKKDQHAAFIVELELGRQNPAESKVWEWQAWEAWKAWKATEFESLKLDNQATVGEMGNQRQPRKRAFFRNEEDLGKREMDPFSNVRPSWS